MLPVLIEDLDAIVLAVADKQPATRIHGYRVRLAALDGTRAFPSPFLDEFPVLGELHDTVVPAVAVAVGDEDGAVRHNQDVVWLVEEIGTRPRDAGLAERHQ